MYGFRKIRMRLEKQPFYKPEHEKQLQLYWYNTNNTICNSIQTTKMLLTQPAFEFEKQ